MPEQDDLLAEITDFCRQSTSPVVFYKPALAIIENDVQLPIE